MAVWQAKSVRCHWGFRNRSWWIQVSIIGIEIEGFLINEVTVISTLDSPYLTINGEKLWLMKITMILIMSSGMTCRYQLTTGRSG